ncbi:MAG: FKBP-type peptidyl-prolyl cis-trans isomerase N-terminal domain-containing protein [bacterium]
MKRLATTAIYVLLMVMAVTSNAQLNLKQFDEVKKPAVFADSLGYTMGFMTGYRIWKDTLNINKDLYLRGLVDGLDSIGRAKMRLMTQKEMDKTFFKFDSVRMAERQKLADEKEALKKKRGEEFLVQGGKFLAENAKQPGVKVTASGLQYKVITEGTGRKPLKEEVAEANFIGKFTDGTVFSDTYKSKDPKVAPKPAMLPIDRIPPGWSEGLLLMPIGSKYILYIPSDLAFGEKGMSQNQQDFIPPNAVLIMEVELIALHDKSTIPEPNQGPPPGGPRPTPGNMKINQGPGGGQK